MRSARILIESNQLSDLVENGFRVKDIADIFHCSKRTIERRMNDLSIKVTNFSLISDDDLDSHVLRVLRLHRQSGEKTIAGHLRCIVQRQRIRECIRRVDPKGVQLRCHNVLHRRKYEVKCPNSLWHLDGYHVLLLFFGTLLFSGV